MRTALCLDCEAEYLHRGGVPLLSLVVEQVPGDRRHLHLRDRWNWKSLCTICWQREPRKRWGGLVPTKCP